MTASRRSQAATPVPGSPRHPAPTDRNPGRRASIRQLLVSSSIALGLACAASAAGAEPDRPNIVLILADDLGYSDLGAFGGEIPTPNLDALVEAGVQMTNFHVAPTCSPTRSMLMSGADNHIAGIGNMDSEMLDEQRGRKGYEGYMTDNVVAFPELLQEAGYHTYMAGKWHLGAGEGQWPVDRGFEKSFALLPGAAHHFDQTGFLSLAPKAAYVRDDQKVDLPEDFYSSDYFTDQLISDIGSGDDEKPFFAYLSFTAPHWPLQAPEENIAPFVGRYDEGYAAIRDARLDKMKSLGLIEPGIEANISPVWPRWDELSAQQQREEARRMEVYAGMVSRIDDNIGRLVTYLKQEGEYDNTIFVFFSDNGAEGQVPEDIMGGADAWWIEENFDNSLENMGKKGSYFGYGPNWAAVSQTPFRMVKGYTYEGGTRSPAFVTYPGWRNGDRSDVFAHVTDIAPTFLEAANAKASTTRNGKQVAPIEGNSMLPWLRGEADRVRMPSQPVCQELFGRVAIWKDDWKLVFSNKPWGTGDWELFNLRSDPTERSDLSSTEAERLASLKNDWEACKTRNDIIWDETLSEKINYTNKDVYLLRPERN